MIKFKICRGDLSYEINADGEAAEKVVFENVYTAPPPIPKTGDNGVAHFWLLIALAFISGLGVFASGRFLLAKG